MRAITALVIACVVSTSALSAQSLGNLARKEEERRKSLPEAAKVLTNADVPSVAQPDVLDVPTAVADSASSADTAKDGTKSDADLSAAKTPAGDAKAEAKAEVKDEKYWAERRKALQAQLDRDEVFAQSLQSRINGLSTDFVNRDDPAQRATIAADRQRAMDEATRLATEIVADKQAIADFEDEARRANVPAGWLR